jgi:hypothetical protein
MTAMTLTIDISIELEQKLEAEAKRRGLSVNEFVCAMMEEHFNQSIRQPNRYLPYGQYRNTPSREFSAEEDFKLTEWHPTEEELNGD